MQASRLNSTSDLRAPASPVRSLAGACIAHALHDGFADLIYVLLPVWQAQFALELGALAMLRGLYVGRLAAFQVPAGHLAYRLNARTILVLGTLLSAAGFALAGLSGGFGGAVRCPRRGRRRQQHTAPARFRGRVSRL